MGKRWVRAVFALGKEEIGAAAMEYALVATLISIVVIASATDIGTALQAIFATVDAAF